MSGARPKPKHFLAPKPLVNWTVSAIQSMDPRGDQMGAGQSGVSASTSNPSVTGALVSVK